ncbi:hypothetical protein M5W78_16125, partial [Paenibacillus larvae]
FFRSTYYKIEILLFFPGQTSSLWRVCPPIIYVADSVNFIKKTRYGGMTDGKKTSEFQER